MRRPAQDLRHVPADQLGDDLARLPADARRERRAAAAHGRMTVAPAGRQESARSGYPKLRSEIGSHSGTHAASPAGRRMPVFWQLAREKSPVPKCSGIRGNSSDISDGNFRADICRFESYMPSQPVPSLRDMSECQKFARRFRELGRQRRVSGALFFRALARSGLFRAAVSGR
jgi:hypothetical protein